MDIETELRAALTVEATFAGGQPNPYPTFIRRETRGRRIRRLRTAIAVAIVTVIIAAVARVQRRG